MRLVTLANRRHFFIKRLNRWFLLFTLIFIRQKLLNGEQEGKDLVII